MGVDLHQRARSARRGPWGAGVAQHISVESGGGNRFLCARFPALPMTKAAPKSEAKAAAAAFAAVDVDGQKLSPETMQAMSKEDLKKVRAKLEPVVKAAKDMGGQISSASTG